MLSFAPHVASIASDQRTLSAVVLFAGLPTAQNVAHTAVGVATAEPYGATRRRFDA